MCRALRPFGTSIFTEMTALSNASGAINLAQGLPDFDGPEAVRRLAAEAILKGPNQFEDDLAFCRYLTERVKVAAIPASFFFHQRQAGRDLVCLCFCKQDATLDEAIRRLRFWRRG